MLALAGLTTMISCNDDDPAPTSPEGAIKNSTWQLNGALMPSQGIENLRITFDDNLNAVAASFTLDGTQESYSEESVSGKATIAGENVDFEVGFGAANEVNFDGTLDEGMTSGSGSVSHRIRKENEGGNPTTLTGVDPDGTIVKQ